MQHITFFHAYVVNNEYSICFALLFTVSKNLDMSSYSCIAE